MTIAVADLVGEAGPKADPQGGAAPTAPVAFRAVRAVTTVGVLQFAVLVVMLARSKVLALLLGPRGVGIVSTLDQLAQFITQLSALSVIAAPTRFVTRAMDDGFEAVTSMYSSLLKMLLVSTAAGTFMAVALLAAQPHLLGGGFEEYRTLAIVAALTAPGLALSGFLANVAAATLGYATTSVYMVLAAVASLMAAWIGIRAAGVTGLYYGNLITGAITVLALGLYLRARVPLRARFWSSRLRDAIRQHPDIVSYCSTSYVLSFAQPLAFLIVRSTMVDRLGMAEAGYFQAAFALSTIASAILTQAVRVYLEPLVNRATSDHSKIAAANEFQRTFVVLILLGTLPLVLFPREIVALLFSRAFTPISTVLFLFVLSDCVFLCNQVYATVVMAVDDFRGFFQAHLAGHVCLCLSVWFAVDRFGLAGIAWSFLASRVLVFVLLHARLYWQRGLTLTPRTAALIAYALAVLITAALAFRADPAAGLAQAGLRMAAFAAASLGTLIFLTNEERGWLRAMSRRLA